MKQEKISHIKQESLLKDFVKYMVMVGMGTAFFFGVEYCGKDYTSYRTIPIQQTISQPHNSYETSYSSDYTTDYIEDYTKKNNQKESGEKPAKGIDARSVDAGIDHFSIDDNVEIIDLP